MLTQHGPASANPLVARIARLGFRKWYERELLAGHAHMVLCVLSVVAMLASMETFRLNSASGRALNAVFVVVSAAIGLWAMRRYFYLLLRAEVIANQANCPECATYGRFAVVAERCKQGEAEVCCRKCNHKWVIVTDE